MIILQHHVNIHTHVPVLDDDITENEVIDAVKRLKDDKSTGDGWVKPMISKLDNCFFYFITIKWSRIYYSCFHMFVCYSGVFL